MITQYEAVNQFLVDYLRQVQQILGSNLVGVYLFGSLTYDDFDPGRSDIDLSVVTNSLLSKSEYESVKSMHTSLEQLHQDWRGRNECSYTPRSMFTSPLPPGDRPYWGESEFYMATYGNEWIINNYLLLEHGVALFGPPFRELCPPISVEQVQAACKQDLRQEWLPKLNDDTWLANPHYQSYLVLNLCRILHTIQNSQAGSKSTSATWVKTHYPQWSLLIDQAISWKHGQTLDNASETKRFLSFVFDKVDIN